MIQKIIFLRTNLISLTINTVLFCCGESCVFPEWSGAPVLPQPKLTAAASIHGCAASSSKLGHCSLLLAVPVAAALRDVAMNLQPQQLLPAWRVPWLSQADPWLDREEPESISQTFYCQVCFTHNPDKVSELALAWFFFAVDCKTSESSDLNYLLLTLETLCFLDVRGKILSHIKLKINI